jgi:hypothetical protein
MDPDAPVGLDGAVSHDEEDAEEGFDAALVETDVDADTEVDADSEALAATDAELQAELDALLQENEEDSPLGEITEGLSQAWEKGKGVCVCVHARSFHCFNQTDAF